LTDVKIPAQEIYFPAQESPISCAGNLFFLRKKFQFPARENKSVAQEILLPCAGNPASKFDNRFAMGVKIKY
jgi:hypothetical protein